VGIKSRVKHSNRFLAKNVDPTKVFFLKHIGGLRIISLKGERKHQNTHTHAQKQLLNTHTKKTTTTHTHTRTLKHMQQHYKMLREGYPTDYTNVMHIMYKML
jgi:glutamate synthase domain-containing protein 3